MTASNHPVVIVGGGLGGLSAALFLAWQGMPPILVERHPGSSPHPRAIGYTPRTMELLRAVGIGDEVPEAPASFRLVRARVDSLAGTWHEQSTWHAKQDDAPPPEFSPVRGAAIAQDRIEPVLRDRAIALGADVRLCTTCLGLEQDGDGVDVLVRDAAGAEQRLRASYVIAADGARSPIREALGIARSGRGHMKTMRSVLFRAPLDEYLARGVAQFEIEQPGLSAFLTTYNDGRWVLMFKDDVERDEPALRAAIRAAIGRDDLPVEIVTTGRWELGALVADEFARGRVFLVGDAAHALPPTRGGYGANTGIQDAHNLAWKLAAVLRGTSSPALLETYDAERRPVAWRRHQQIFARPDYRAEGRGIADDEPILDDDAMEFGQLYRSTAVIGAGDELPPARRPDEWAGQPGTRAPHAWIERDGQRVSTLALFQRRWVLLADDAAWADAAHGVGARFGVELACVRIGVDVATADRDALRRAFGLAAGGALLVRPDGIVAWRAAILPTRPREALAEALASVSSAR